MKIDNLINIITLKSDSVNSFEKGAFEEVVDELAIDAEVQQLLNKHDDRITNLETKVEVIDVRLRGMEDNINDVKSSITKFENTFMTQSTLQMQTMAQLLGNATNSNTQLATDVAKTRSQIDAKRIGLYGTMITAFVGLATYIVKAIWG